MRVPNLNQSLTTPKLQFRLSNINNNDVSNFVDVDTSKSNDSPHRYVDSSNATASICFFTSSSLPDFDSLQKKRRSNKSNSKNSKHRQIESFRSSQK